MSGLRISDSPTRIALTPASLERFNVLSGVNAAFAHDNFIRWDGFNRAERGCDICLEGFEVAVIDADDFCVCL